MSAAQREPGAKTGTEGTEVRKASNGAGFKAMDEYGKGTEEVRKHSISVSSRLCMTAPRCAPSVWCAGWPWPREGFPARAVPRGRRGARLKTPRDHERRRPVA